MSSSIRVLVTGASAGVGYVLVQRLASTGYLVYGCARNIQKIEELRYQGFNNVHAIKCDVSKEDEVSAMFREINEKNGGLDICVNNAGMASDDTILDGSVDKWRQMYEVNVIGLCMVTQHAVKSMQAGGGDNCIIMNVNSILGLASAKFTIPMRSFYTGTKHAVTGITSSLRGELSQKGLDSKIRVMQICPGLIETEFAARSSGEEVARQLYSSYKPLQSEDVADSIIYALKTPKHVTITDQVLWPTESINRKL